MLKPGFEKKIPEERRQKKAANLLQAKIRAGSFYYQGNPPVHFLFGRKSTEEAAEELGKTGCPLAERACTGCVYRK